MNPSKLLQVSLKVTFSMENLFCSQLFAYHQCCFILLEVEDFIILIMVYFLIEDSDWWKFNFSGFTHTTTSLKLCQIIYIYKLLKEGKQKSD